MRIFLLVALSSVIFFACSKSDIQGTGTITGSATTCGGWLIQDQNKKILQPVNWDDFTVTLKTGQSISFSYYIVNGGNLCQMGQTIHLVTAEDR